MKYILAVFFVFGCNAFAEAGSFQQLLNEQAVTTISPVQFDGLPVIAMGRDGLETASLVCRALGFARTVDSSIDLKQFEYKDKVAIIKNWPGVPGVITEEVGVRKINVMTSVQCAR